MTLLIRPTAILGNIICWLVRGTHNTPNLLFVILYTSFAVMFIYNGCKFRVTVITLCMSHYTWVAVIPLSYVQIRIGCTTSDVTVSCSVIYMHVAAWSKPCKCIAFQQKGDCSLCPFSVERILPLPGSLHYIFL
jgi:hypothetical protein